MFVFFLVLQKFSNSCMHACIFRELCCVIVPQSVKCAFLVFPKDRIAVSQCVSRVILYKNGLIEGLSVEFIASNDSCEVYLLFSMDIFYQYMNIWNINTYNFLHTSYLFVGWYIINILSTVKLTPIEKNYYSDLRVNQLLSNFPSYYEI